MYFNIYDNIKIDECPRRDEYSHTFICAYWLSQHIVIPSQAPTCIYIISYNYKLCII